MTAVRDTGAPRAATVFLLTDFGTTDPFVGVMKAVILRGCPGATLVDLTHGIPPQAISVGAFWLERILPWLPPGAVVLAVVDPGVGTARAGVVVTADGRLFVGPDNGLLELATRSDPGRRACRIDGGLLGLPEPSSTFHGRDVFAPVAARLAAGTLAANEVGPELPKLVEMTGLLAPVAPAATPSPHGEGIAAVKGVVAVVDHFGNLLTTIATGALAALGPPGKLVVEIGGRSVPIRDAYGDASAGEIVALPCSWGVLEIAASGGNASRALGVACGAPVVVRAAS